MPRRSTDFDALIIGGGHNGLVCAGYLAKAGLNVLVLERRPFVGGAAATEELFPGYRLSSCSYICHLLQPKIIDDFELRRHGFDVYQLDPELFVPFPDGRRLCVFSELDRTQEELARFSPHDARAYPAWKAFWKDAAGLVYRHFLKPPPTLSELFASLDDPSERALLERLLWTNMKDLLREFFEDPHVQAAFVHAHDVGDPSAAGSAWCYTHVKCNLFSRREDVGIVKGGMGTVTQALARSVAESGVTIRTSAAVDRLLVEQGSARGFRLDDGTEITARVVVSNADPKRTFLKLVDRDNLPEGFARRVARLKTKTSYLKFHAALNRLPDFSRYFDNGFDPRCLADMKICPSIEYFEQSWLDARRGVPARQPVMEVQIPSVYDPTLTPEGHHVVSVWGIYAPPRPRDATWDELREPVGERLIDVLSQYAPDFRDCLVDWSLFTPADLEHRVGLTDGNIRHLDMVPDQYLANRPLPDWRHYRTPIDNLYLCGAGTHPGGEVTGAPGYNAAGQILGELRQSA